MRRHGASKSVAKSGVEIMGQRHTSESYANFIRRGHPSCATSSTYVVRHTSLVMRRAAKSYVEAILPSLKSVRISSQIQSHRQGLGPHSRGRCRGHTSSSQLKPRPHPSSSPCVASSSSHSKPHPSHHRAIRQLPSVKVSRQPSSPSVSVEVIPHRQALLRQHHTS